MDNNDDKTNLLSHSNEQQSSQTICLIEDDEKHGTWFSAGFHMICVLCGVGVLSLPWALSYLNWTAGILIFFAVASLSAYSCCLLAQLHELDDKRLNRYIDVGNYFMRPWITNITIVPAQFIMLGGVGVVYTIVAGQLMQHTVQIFNGNIELIYCQILFGVVEAVIAQAPNLHSITFLSIFGSTVAFLYSAIAIVTSILQGIPDDINYPQRDKNFADQLSGMCSAIGIFFTSFSGQNVILEVQSTMRQRNGSSAPGMITGIVFANSVCAMIFLAVAITGYAAYGNNVPDNLLLAIQRPQWLVVIANVGIVIHVIAAYQILGHVIFISVDYFVNNRMKTRSNRVQNFVINRFVRVVFVVFLTLLAISFPYLGDVLGFIGAISIGLNGFVLPNLFWIQNGKRTLDKWIVNLPLTFVGVLTSIICLGGSLRSIFVKAVNGP